MTIFRKTNEQKKTGFTLIEMLITVGVIGVITGLIVTRFTGVFATQNGTLAQAEVEMLRQAALRYRSAPARNGSYTGMTLLILSNNGYGVDPFTNGVGENVYGQNVTLTGTGETATLIYNLPTLQECNAVAESLGAALGGGTANFRRGITAAACAVGALTVTFD